MIFTREELEAAIARRDRDLLDSHLESRGVESCLREFYLQSKPNREGKRSAAKVENDHRLARAKLLYKERMAAHGNVERARAEMIERFPMALETAVKLTEGRMTAVNQILLEYQDRPISKSGGATAE